MDENSATLALEPYEQEEFASSSTFTGPAGNKGTASVGLSPFNIPNAVELALHRDGSCSFRFDYGTEEPAQRNFHRVPGSWVAVRIGKNSGRVLEVCAESSLQLFAPDAYPIKLTPKNEWYPHLPLQMQIVAGRQAMLVERILNYAVDRLRPQVLEAIQTKSTG